MPEILNSLQGFFRKQDWNFQLFEDESVIRMQFSGENGSWLCAVQAFEERRQILYYSHSPMVCPAENLDALCRFTTRLNYRMIIGNFEVDLATGRSRFKTSLDLGDHPVSDSLIAPVVFTNCVMMDRYLPSLNAVISGVDDRTAFEALVTKPT